MLVFLSHVVAMIVDLSIYAWVIHFVLILRVRVNSHSQTYIYFNVVFSCFQVNKFFLHCWCNLKEKPEMQLHPRTRRAFRRSFRRFDTIWKNLPKNVYFVLDRYVTRIDFDTCIQKR
jgi:hypothetical protein